MDSVTSSRLIFSTRCPLAQISGFWKFERRKGLKTTARSTAGHLIHYIISGHYNVTIGRRDYKVKPGDMIYYYQEEDVACDFYKDAAFYSVAFAAPDFEPLPMDFRVFPASGKCDRYFRKLSKICIENNLRTAVYAAHGALLNILAEIQRIRPDLKQSAGYDAAWSEIEHYIRSKHIFRPSLDELSDKFRLSISSLIRLCRRVNGKTPIQYFKALRMEEARSLLLLSGMNVSEVSEYLRYGRMHEFSREFSGHFGYPPSKSKDR
ncbi:MAG: AraC family transcriptional regulator [Lentisphaerota bacterium]